MAAGMETAFAVALRSRWPACAAPNLSGCGHAQTGAAGGSGKLPCGEHRARGAPKSFACARPLHRRRDRRRASPFPDSSPPPGERIKERGGRTAQAESKEEGGRIQRLEVAPAAPLTLPSPPKGRGRQERGPRARMTEAEAPRGGMTKVARPAAACHPRAWPLHRRRDTRHASPFPDSSPPPGERIKERGGTHRASAVEGVRVAMP